MYPDYKLTNPGQYHHLIFDGTFLHRPKSVVGLMDAKTNTIISGKYGISENSISQLTSFFAPLKESGLKPISCTTDGNPQAIQTLKVLWPNITVQRCLVHIQRQGLMWCRQNPKRTNAKALREIFLKVPFIYSESQRDLFLEEIMVWEKKYGQYIACTTEKSKVIEGIKKARSMLTKAIPDMFHYLKNSNIPRTTNSLEGYFSRLKSHYRDHRGLSKNKLDNYFSWYFYFRPK